MATTVEEMEQQRTAKVESARAPIDKADKAKLAKANKEAKAERERAKQATADRRAKAAAKPAAKATARKKGATAKLTDAELVTAVKKVVGGMDNSTPSGVVKAVRASGVSAAGNRIRAATSGKSKQAKGAAAKVREKEAGLGIHH